MALCANLLRLHPTSSAHPPPSIRGTPCKMLLAFWSSAHHAHTSGPIMLHPSLRSTTAHPRKKLTSFSVRSDSPHINVLPSAQRHVRIPYFTEYKTVNSQLWLVLRTSTSSHPRTRLRASRTSYPRITMPEILSFARLLGYRPDVCLFRAF
jgi:hypothetical protein